MTEDMTTLEYFEQNKFVVIPNLLDPLLVEFLSSYYSTMGDSKDGYFGRDRTSLNGYGDACADAVMYMIREKIEAHVGMELVPGFSFVRHYKKGDSVGRHIDREANQINTTTTITMDADWPIEFQHKFGGKKYVLKNKPGVGVAFWGLEMDHWRHKYMGESQVQLIAGFIVKGGEFDTPQFRFDGHGKPSYMPKFVKKVPAHKVLQGNLQLVLRKVLGGKYYMVLRDFKHRVMKVSNDSDHR